MKSSLRTACGSQDDSPNRFSAACLYRADGLVDGRAPGQAFANGRFFPESRILAPGACEGGGESTSRVIPSGHGLAVHP
jgi:hypothetical protein